METESDRKGIGSCDCSGEVTVAQGIAAPQEAISPPITTPSDASCALEIDKAIFSVDSVLRAAYKFTDRCHVFLQTHQTKPDRWLVVMCLKAATDSGQQLAGDFANELIDQRLRERLEQQFGDVRTLIVAQAFAEGNLLDPNRDDGDYQTDPKGIGRLRP